MYICLITYIHGKDNEVKQKLEKMEKTGKSIEENGDAEAGSCLLPPSPLTQ
jgi:hypothetical protein